MTYDEEIKKLRKEHRYSIIRSVIDKLLLGGVVAVVAFFGQHLLKGYESELANQRHLAEMRFEGIFNIREAYAKLSDQHTIYAGNVAVLDVDANNIRTIDEMRRAYIETHDAFRAALNKWGFLFSDGFMLSALNHGEFHAAVASGSRQTHKGIWSRTEAWSFASHVDNSFGTLTQRALYDSELHKPDLENDKTFSLDTWKPQRIQEIGLEQFFNQQFDRWRNWRENN